ncbi:DUF1152 domain-containing protein [Nocardia sp. NPDC051832]|uniref:DUF1152 domain-containing protein n=1 Tax=Nocardia sp. NPDC051832 TaxID=3155673 RepID=UPI00344988E9
MGELTHGPEIFRRLEGCSSVLIAGAGGGFDVYAGLPVAFALRDLGIAVHLANLSFTALADVDPYGWIDEHVVAVTPRLAGPEHYFPERTLSIWMAEHDQPSTVYAFPRTGVRGLRAGYRTLIKELGIDAIVLVDGGTDILLRGDEMLLGTPEEDATSLAAVAGLEDVPVRLVAGIGFGIDAFHGVNHVHVLENIAELDAAGAYLGAFSLPGRSSEACRYRDAVEHAATHTARRPSLVNGQIAAATLGRHGQVRIGGRRADNLFVNPLMAVYFTFDLPGLAARNAYLPTLEDTESMADVRHRIGRYRAETALREPRPFPH